MHLRKTSYYVLLLGLVQLAIGLAYPRCASASPPGRLRLSSSGVQLVLDGSPLRATFFYRGVRVFSETEKGTIEINGEGAVLKQMLHREGSGASLLLATASGATAKLAIQLTDHSASLTIQPDATGGRIVFRTGGAAPGYGLGDHAVLRQPFNTDVTGFMDEHVLSGEGQNGTMRLESNFIIYPKQHAALVLIDPTEKIIASSATEIVQGVVASRQSETGMHYFFGTPHEMYLEFLKVRNAAGYPVLEPKYEMFGVGWEAFGALGINTNQGTDTESVDRYLKLGYPLRWMVIGSGFWPVPKSFHETTSFGLFNPDRYPAPKEMFAHFHGEGLKVLFGLRLCFITDGPFSSEGVKLGYFLKDEQGAARIFHGGWPESPYYLLDSHNAEALSWYIGLTKRWTDAGVDGFKEDFYDFGGFGLRDDKVDPINTRLMRNHAYLIERNGYLSSNADLHRINDFNYDQNQDRGPVNALALAYAGLPLVYPDIVGGTVDHLATRMSPRLERYMARNAQWASVHPSMAMGQPPWLFPSAQTGDAMLKAAQLHGRLQPYLYSQAVQFSRDGYPWTLTPLPIAFPDDPAVYGRENDRVRGYEWMIGTSLLATPLYGDDYETAERRDVYLPAGLWIDYDTGQKFRGPQMLKNWEIPVGKSPLFVGGDGVLVEMDGSVTVARVYPVGVTSNTIFAMPAGQTSVAVHVVAGDLATAHVRDVATGASIDAAWVRNALQWPVEAGNRYEVR